MSDPGETSTQLAVLSTKIDYLTGIVAEIRTEEKNHGPRIQAVEHKQKESENREAGRVWWVRSIGLVAIGHVLANIGKWVIKS